MFTYKSQPAPGGLPGSRSSWNRGHPCPRTVLLAPLFRACRGLEARAPRREARELGQLRDQAGARAQSGIRAYPTGDRVRAFAAVSAVPFAGCRPEEAGAGRANSEGSHRGRVPRGTIAADVPPHQGAAVRLRHVRRQHSRAPATPAGKGPVPRRHRAGGRARARVRAEPLAARADPVHRRRRGAPRAGGGGGGHRSGSRGRGRPHSAGDGNRRLGPVPGDRLAPGGPGDGPLRGGDRGRGRGARPVPRRGRGRPRRGRLRAAPGGRGRALGVRRGRAPPARARAGQRALPHRVVVRGEGAGAVRAGPDPGPSHLPPPPRLGDADGGERSARRLRPDERDPRVLLLHPGAPHPAGRPRPLSRDRGGPDPGGGARRRRRLRPEDAAPPGGGGGGRSRGPPRPPRQVGPGPDGAPPVGVPFAGRDRRGGGGGGGGRPPRRPPGERPERRRSVLVLSARLLARPADGGGGAPRAVPPAVLPLRRGRRRHQPVSHRGVPRGGVPSRDARDRRAHEPDRPRRGSRPGGGQATESPSSRGAAPREPRRGGVRQWRLPGAPRERPRSRALRRMAGRAAARSRAGRARAPGAGSGSGCPSSSNRPA